VTKSPILPTIHSPHDLKDLSLPQLEKLAAEMREVLCNLVSCRSAHFASNLGVVELCLALHQTFDFTHDRLIWDTGHQIYPHKLITGRYPQFQSMRTKGGLMGYPNPEEERVRSVHDRSRGIQRVDGCRPGQRLTNWCGDDEGRWSVAVIGDGAFPSGIVFEALNNVGRSSKRLLVILNDNKMSICPRVGGVADYLDRLRMNRMYSGLKEEVVKVLGKVPLLGDPVERFFGADQRSGESGPARRHAVRRHGYALLRADRWAQHWPVAQISANGAECRRTDSAACGDGKGTRLPAGRRGSGAVPRAAAVERQADKVVQMKKSSSRGVHACGVGGHFPADDR